MTWWLVILIFTGGQWAERVFPHELSHPAFCEIISVELQPIYPHEHSRCVMGEKPDVPDLLLTPGKWA
jgi:hypothetical protein